MRTFLEQMIEFDKRRRRAHIVDRELAEEVGMTQTTISRYRRGRQQPSVDRWGELQAALDRLIAKRAKELRRLT
jgi:transcriptional regulator with XRE-family HTH domain